MKRWLQNIQKNWYKYAMEVDCKKLERLIEEGRNLTSDEILEASRKVDGHMNRFAELKESMEQQHSMY